MNVEIEFLEWVHPRAGVTKVEVEGGKPLVLKAKIKQEQNEFKEWVSLTDEDLENIKLLTFEKEINSDGKEQEAVDLDHLMRATEQLCKERNT